MNIRTSMYDAGEDEEDDDVQDDDYIENGSLFPPKRRLFSVTEQNHLFWEREASLRMIITMSGHFLSRQNI